MRLKKLLARIPQELPKDPKGMGEFIKDILDTYSLPNTPEYRKALAKAIHGVSQNTHRAPKHIFYAYLRRFEAMRAAVVTITEIEKAEKQAATPKEGPKLVDEAAKGTDTVLVPAT